MKKAVLIIYALLFLPYLSAAGEWCCNNPVDVISGKSDPKEQCIANGRWVGVTKSTAEYMDCALTDIFHSLKYPGAAREQYNYSMYEEKSQAVIDHVPHIYKNFPSTRENIRRGLLRSLAYFDREHRSTFDPLFAGTPDAALWATLSAAADNKPQAVAKAFYQWCDNHNTVIEFVYFGHPPTIKEIVAERAHTGLRAFGGRIDCANAQGYVYGRLESDILSGKLIVLPSAELLASNYLRRLLNTVYARHGREFKNEDLKRWFLKRNWYKPSAAYDDSLLNDIDRKNITVMQQVVASD
jgi:hypothetical protein